MFRNIVWRISRRDRRRGPCPTPSATAAPARSARSRWTTAGSTSSRPACCRRSTTPSTWPSGTRWRSCSPAGPVLLGRLRLAGPRRPPGGRRGPAPARGDAGRPHPLLPGAGHRRLHRPRLSGGRLPPHGRRRAPGRGRAVQARPERGAPRAHVAAVRGRAGPASADPGRLRPRRGHGPCSTPGRRGTPVCSIRSLHPTISPRPHTRPRDDLATLDRQAHATTKRRVRAPVIDELRAAIDAELV